MCHSQQTILTNNTRKYLNLIIKIAVLLLAGWYIYSKVSSQHNLHEFKLLMKGLDRNLVTGVLVAVVVLMFCNWFLEIVKWKFISRRIEHLSWWRATEAVFCGLTWAIFTPNRIGEYGGRVMYLKAENRASGAVAMGVGHFAQLVLTSIFGALSIAWFMTTFLSFQPGMKILIWIAGIVYATLFLLIFFNVHWVDRLVRRIKFLKKIQPFFSVLEDYNRRELSVILGLSLSRFIIFTSQYIILMEVILPDLPFLSMVLMIFILFFIQSAVPSLDLFDFSVRSFVASNLYSYITTQEIAVMAIVSCIWFVNLILPAILGSVFAIKVNYLSDNKS